jgi:predicted nucleotidyltransferase
VHDPNLIPPILRRHFPSLQAIYLYGSYGTPDEHSQSDVDVGVLLPHAIAKAHPTLWRSDARLELERALRRDIDLVNMRLVSTVLQKEIIAADRCIACADRAAVDEFEMLVLFFYQKLNEERRDIVEAFLASGRAYPV